MSKRKGLIDRLKIDEALVEESKEKSSNAYLISEQDEQDEQDFPKERQTVYMKQNYIQAIKYKAFVEDKSFTDIYNEMLEKFLTEEEIEIGSQRVREQ